MESVKDTIDDLSKAVSVGMDPGNVRVWLHAKVKTTFMDRNYKEHGSMICGIVQASNVQASYGFFMSKCFAKVRVLYFQKCQKSATR